MTSKSTCSKKDQNYKNITKHLDKISFEKHAIESRFKQRKERKITGRVLLIAFIVIALQGKSSFGNWAEQIGVMTGKTVSKQGLWKRVTVRLVKFLWAVLFDALRQQTLPIHKYAARHPALRRYNRVLIQDSTAVALPDCLSWCFPGTVSKGKKKAQLKIQVIYDLLRDEFLYFQITPFTANDQSCSKDILSMATDGDLVLRDMGYFALDCFETMKQDSIHFISRLRYGVKIYDCKSGKEINLLQELQKQEGFDQWVMIGKEQKVKVRLVALKLPEPQANQRRRKARDNRDRRLCHSQQYYDLLGYHLFITSQQEDVFTATQIAQAYQLRWRIEIIFKCWKSQFHLQKLIPANGSLTKERAESIIYMMLIFIILFKVPIYQAALIAAQKIPGCFISLMKLCKYIATHVHLFFEEQLNFLMPKILYYCSYEKRRDRANFVQKLNLC